MPPRCRLLVSVSAAMSEVVYSVGLMNMEEDEPPASDAATQVALSRVAMTAAWEATGRNGLRPDHSQCTTEVANARMAVEYLRTVGDLPHCDPQVKQDMVYLLDNLTGCLLGHADDDPEYLAQALASSDEAYARQQAIVARRSAQIPRHRFFHEDLETLESVGYSRAAVYRAAGLENPLP